MALLRVRFAPCPQLQKMGVARQFYCSEIERSLDKKDAEPPATCPEAPVRRCSGFSSQGRGDRQPAFGAPPSLSLDPAQTQSRTGKTGIIQESLIFAKFGQYQAI